MTGQSEHLPPYNDVTNALDRQRNQLRMLYTNVAEVRPTLDELDRLVDIKLDELDTTIALRRNEGFGAALTVVQSDTGRRTMEGIQQLLRSEMQYGLQCGGFAATL